MQMNKYVNLSQESPRITYRRYDSLEPFIGCIYYDGPLAQQKQGISTSDKQQFTIVDTYLNNFFHRLHFLVWDVALSVFGRNKIKIQDQVQSAWILWIWIFIPCQYSDFAFHVKENFPEDAGHEKKETEDSRCGAHPPGGRVHVHLRIYFFGLWIGFKGLCLWTWSTFDHCMGPLQMEDILGKFWFLLLFLPISNYTY